MSRLNFSSRKQGLVLWWVGLFGLVSLLLFAHVALSLRPASTPRRVVHDWTDPALMDDPAEALTYQTCSLEVSPLEDLPFYDALKNATVPRTPDGHLRLDALDGGGEGLGWHPVLLLMKEGEERFKQKLARQSKTFEQAVGEYRRRYGRSPPKGFDIWWEFASSNNVLFPDEHYATDALSPFYALSPASRQARLLRASSEAADGTFEGSGDQALVRIFNGPDGLGWAPLLDSDGKERRRPRKEPTHKRTRAQLALLQPIQHLLPRFSAVLNNADQPVVLLDPMIDEDLEDADGFSTHLIDWQGFCGRRNAAFGLNNTESDATDVVFVQDPRRASDPCLNPQLLEQHGFYLQDSGGKSRDIFPLTHKQLLPILSLSPTIHHADIPIVPVGIEGHIEKGALYGNPWQTRLRMAYWRGSATGLWNHGTDPKSWPQAQRTRLSKFANSGTAVSPSLSYDARTGQAALAPLQSVRWKRWLNIHLASSKWWLRFSWWPETGQQCDVETCKALGKDFHYAEKDPKGQADLYKWVMDVDGNGWSARFPRLLAGQSLVLKSTAFTEWNSDLFPTWYGYVPVSNSYADLESILRLIQLPYPTTSDGTVPPETQMMDGVARKMAELGRCWKTRTMRVVDMQAYMLRLYLEYAGLFGSPEEEEVEILHQAFAPSDSDSLGV